MGFFQVWRAILSLFMRLEMEHLLSLDVSSSLGEAGKGQSSLGLLSYSHCTHPLLRRGYYLLEHIILQTCSLLILRSELCSEIWVILRVIWPMKHWGRVLVLIVGYRNKPGSAPFIKLKDHVVSINLSLWLTGLRIDLNKLALRSELLLCLKTSHFRKYNVQVGSSRRLEAISLSIKEQYRIPHQ